MPKVVVLSRVMTLAVLLPGLDRARAAASGGTSPGLPGPASPADGSPTPEEHPRWLGSR
jgi:hypothetical protein